MVDFFQFDDETDVTDSLGMVGLSVIAMFTYEFVWDLERIHQISNYQNGIVPNKSRSTWRQSACSI